MRPYTGAAVALAFARRILVLLVRLFVLKYVFLLAGVAYVLVEVFNLLYQEELVLLGQLVDGHDAVNQQLLLVLVKGGIWRLPLLRLLVDIAVIQVTAVSVFHFLLRLGSVLDVYR